MAQPTSRSETCNNKNNLDGSQHNPHCNQDNHFPFPGFTINNKVDLEDYTPIAKIHCESTLKCPNSFNSTEENSSSTTTKTPPVEPSISPEIQSSLYRSIHVSGAVPSTCYGAGHVISGITDRRKCKARGILSAGLSKRGQDIFRKSSPSLIPFPTEASISWHLSPDYVDKHDNVVGKDDYSKGLSSISPSVQHTPQEERVLSLDFNGECSPFSADFLSSGNVMQTPNSDSSIEGFQLKYQFESELDKVTNVLEHESLSPRENSSPWDPPRLSSEFEDLSPLSENVSESQMRISWRDELISGTFDKDDLDCCRLLSDEENELLKSPKFLESEVKADEHEKETSFPTRIKICEESNQSICTDDGGLTTSADSDWTQHYKNQSFEL
ncbi:hypothetical protein L1887_07623 [Cichorium endivia]|nr:hypothetical protein L1887_07623 [Cichorium endivia]